MSTTNDHCGYCNKRKRVQLCGDELCGHRFCDKCIEKEGAIEDCETCGQQLCDDHFRPCESDICKRRICDTCADRRQCSLCNFVACKPCRRKDPANAMVVFDDDKKTIMCKDCLNQARHV